MRVDLHENADFEVWLNGRRPSGSIALADSDEGWVEVLVRSAGGVVCRRRSYGRVELRQLSTGVVYRRDRARVPSGRRHVA